MFRAALQGVCAMLAAQGNLRGTPEVIGVMSVLARMHGVTLNEDRLQIGEGTVGVISVDLATYLGGYYPVSLQGVVGKFVQVR
jgi:hypothetical protein